VSPPEPEDCDGRSRTEPATTEQSSADPTDTGHFIAPYDWRHAARVTEDFDALAPIDHALTATGLAAQISECADRIGRLPK
jgi:hypothetical protein